MAEDAKPTDEQLQLVVFALGDEEFGVDIKNVQEIIRMTSITKIPQVSDHVSGIINLRGRIIVVINLNAVLGLENAAGQDENTRIVVADVGDTVVGFTVDSVSEVIRLPVKNIEPAPDMVADRIGAEYIRGVGKVNSRLLILLKLDKIISADRLDSTRTTPAEKAPSAS